jgi:hypothetical protein
VLIAEEAGWGLPHELAVYGYQYSGCMQDFFLCTIGCVRVDLFVASNNTPSD